MINGRSRGAEDPFDGALDLVNRHQLRILRNQVTSQGLDEFSARYLEMLNHGALSLREGKLEEGFAESRAAVKQADALRYDEPPGWLIPVRHSLGASLMQVGRRSRYIAMILHACRKMVGRFSASHRACESRQRAMRKPLRPTPGSGKSGPKPRCRLQAPVSVSQGSDEFI